MTEPLQVSHCQAVTSENQFLSYELVEGHAAGEAAHEAALFDFALTNYEMGARVITLPPKRFFAEHTHPYAHHFLIVLEGTAILIYDGQRYMLKAGDTCLVLRGVVHKLGAGENGVRVICVNAPTYEQDDPDHAHYIEDEMLESVTLDHDSVETHPYEHKHEHAHSHHH